MLASVHISPSNKIELLTKVKLRHYKQTIDILLFKFQISDKIPITAPKPANCYNTNFAVDYITILQSSSKNLDF